jgi:hypothetical protein
MNLRTVTQSSLAGLALVAAAFAVPSAVSACSADNDATSGAPCTAAEPTCPTDCGQPGSVACVDGTWVCQAFDASICGDVISETVCTGDAPSCPAGCDASMPATCQADGGWACSGSISNISCGEPAMALEAGPDEDADVSDGAAALDAADAHD